jgi:hypothetical protein
MLSLCVGGGGGRDIYWACSLLGWGGAWAQGLFLPSNSRLAAMEVTISVTLFLLLSSPCLSQGTENITVQEIDGLLYVTEPVNTFRISRHVQLWSADLQGDVDKLDVLMASKTISELSILMTSINQLTAISPYGGTDSTGIGTYSDTSLPGNLVRRYKRNILGDALNYLSGVPTAEMMAKQVKLDEKSGTK